MRLFKKVKPVEEVSGIRRRPLPDGRPPAAQNRQIFSYHSRRSADEANTGRREPLEPVADYTQRPVTYRYKPWLVVVTLVLVAVAGYISLLTPDPDVTLLQDDTTAYFLQDAAVYRGAVRQQLQSSLLDRNKLTINTAAVRLELLRQYPEIKDVTVGVPLVGRQPQVYIEPYHPAFIMTTVTGQAFLLDETGRALATTNQIADIDSLKLATVEDKSGTEVKLGAKALPASTVAFVDSVIRSFQSTSLGLNSLVLLANSSELDARAEDQPYYVKFNLQNDALQQAGTFLAVKNRLDGQKIVPNQYIDVRVPERAYYK